MNLSYAKMGGSQEYWQRIRERERYRREVEMRPAQQPAQIAKPPR